MEGYYRRSHPIPHFIAKETRALRNCLEMFLSVHVRTAIKAAAPEERSLGTPAERLGRPSGDEAGA